MPVAFPPISLRRRVIETSVSPERGDSRTLIMERGDSFDKSGFPMVIEPRSRRKPRRAGPAVIAAMGVLAATAVMIVLNGADGEAALQVVRPPTSVVPVEPTDPGADPLSEPVQIPELRPDGAEPTATPTTLGPLTASPRLRTPPPVVNRPSSGRTPTRRPQTRPVPPAARLLLGCPGEVAGTGTVRISARNAAVTWNGTASGGLGLYPAGGTVKAGDTMAVWVTVDDPGTAGSGGVSIQSNGGRSSCSISWIGDQGEGPADPPPDPTPSPSTSSTTTSDDGSGETVE